MSHEDANFRRDFRTIFADTGHRTLNALLIVSGGAAVSFLTFIGSSLTAPGVAARIGTDATEGFAFAMQLFVGSVACCVLAHGLTYLSHAAYYFQYNRSGNALMGVVVVLCVACIATFVYGSYAAIEAFGHAAKALIDVTVG
jgi:hypothetical protein